MDAETLVDSRSLLASVQVQVSRCAHSGNQIHRKENDLPPEPFGREPARNWLQERFAEGDAATARFQCTSALDEARVALSGEHGVKDLLGSA